MKSNKPKIETYGELKERALKDKNHRSPCAMDW